MFKKWVKNLCSGCLKIIFLIYTVYIFWIKNYAILAGLCAFQIILTLLWEIPIQEAIKSIWKLIPFILFTAIINIWTMGLNDAILIGIKLIIVCNITYIFGKTTTAMQISKAIQNLLYPLKWFGINTNNIGVMVSIAITFIPIIQQEIQNIKYSLLSKGINMSFINQIKHINYIMVPLFYSLLRKVRYIEEALISKGYVEE